MSAGRRQGWRAQENAATIRTVLINQDPTAAGAEIWRTAITGPSGQRSNILVGKIRYVSNQSSTRDFEVEIIDPATGFTAGYARRVLNVARCVGIDIGVVGIWAIYSLSWDGYVDYLGEASSLAVGCDVLFNGPNATRWANHDTRRVSPGTFHGANTGRGGAA